MDSAAITPEEYIASLPDDRRDAVARVREVVNEHLPDGYIEPMDWTMISWVVPLERCPDTYNGKPLCYASLASQKHHMALYLMGVYGDAGERAWLERQYAERHLKLDMGKSCVRFGTLDALPLDVVGEAVARIPVERFVDHYAEARRR